MNILLLFTDQHRADVVGYEDHPDVLTPNLDRLAAEGVRFSRAYCQDGVCVPSRTSMMCGLYPRTVGSLHNNDRCETMRHVVPMAEAFRRAGYLTAAFGKRHLPDGRYACDDGWMVRASHLPNESPDDDYRRWLGDAALRNAFERDWAAEWGPNPAPLASRPSELPADKTMEAFTAQHTIGLIRRAAAEKQPFFCWASFYRPHQPYTPLPPYLARFDTSHWGRGRRLGDGLALPAAFHEPRENQPPGLIGHTADSETWPIDAARRNPAVFRNYIASYYACLEEVDDHVGRILDCLDATGQAERTIVIYSSDHGEFVGAHGMAEKAATGHNVYLDTLRVPLLMRCPGLIQPGAVCDGLAELVDLYPTLLDLTGVQPPDMPFDLAGCSLAETLTRGTPIGRAYSVSENWSQKTVITKDRVLGVWQDPAGKQLDQRNLSPDMLFDLESDPHQTNNVFDDPGYGNDRNQLAGRLRQWEAHTPDMGKRCHVEAAYGYIADGRATTPQNT